MLSVIRAIEPTDVEGLLSIWEQASASAHDFLCDSFVVDERALIPSTYLQAVQTWVYELNGELVAFLTLFEAEITAIFVRPDANQDEIGSALVEHAMSEHEQLETCVFEKNEVGWLFCDRFGFERIGRFTHIETQEVLIRMRWVRSS